MEPTILAKLAPSETTLPVTDISHWSPEQYESTFGKLHFWRDKFLAKYYFGRCTKEYRSKRILRHYFLGTFDRLSSPLRFHIRDTQVRTNKTTGQPETVLVDAVCKLTAEDLRIMCGATLYQQLLANHQHTILGAAIQLIEDDALDYQAWIESRGRARPIPPPAFDQLNPSTPHA